MKRILPLLLMAVACRGASFYADNAATGAGTGLSWADAWVSFAAINWASVNPGDTVYISGGATSKTYSGTLTIGASGTLGNPITIRTGQDVGHTGTVILDGDYVEATGVSYVTLSGNVGGAQRLSLINYFNTTDRTFGNKVMCPGSTGFTLEYCTASNVNQVVGAVGCTGLHVNHVTATDVRGDAAVRAVNSTGSWDANIIENCDLTLSLNAGLGPDGVQGSHGITVRNNRFTVANVAYLTSSQHTDYTQIIGNYIKIYGNEFQNIGDSANDFDWWVNPTPHDIWIYNNLYRITADYDPYPEYIRFYSSSGAVTSITNFKVFNNDFVDNPGWANFYVAWDNLGTPTLSGVQVVNNIFVNSGGILIPDQANIDGTSFGFSHNVYASSTPISYRGTSYTATTWSAVEATRIVGTPTFSSYMARAVVNDFRLLLADTVARGEGVDLSAYFTTDKNGAARLAPWDVGAYATTITPIVGGAPNAKVHHTHAGRLKTH